MSYVNDKIQHLIRVGLLSKDGKHVGTNGGACPTWLQTMQKERDEAFARQRRMRGLREIDARHEAMES